MLPYTLFPYSPGSNDVIVDKKDEFDHCTQSEPLKIFYMEPAIINPTARRDYYYITYFGKHRDYG